MSDTPDEMHVVKRNGSREIVAFDKILTRIKATGAQAGIQAVNYTLLAMKVIDQLHDGITTTKIDEVTADQCASMASTHPDYNTLAGHIIISNHQKNTPSTFSEAMTQLYEFRDLKGSQSPLVSQDLYDLVQERGAELDAICGDCSRDFLIDYFGFKTLERAYLFQVNKVIVERPQYMWLRVAIGIHYAGSSKDDEDLMARIRNTYDGMSLKYFTHATPTLFNAGTPHPQLSSCFLQALESDSIDGIYKTLHDCATISKWAGGIGLHIHNLRARGSHIRGTNGTSNGLVPMLRVFNATAKYVDQGGGKRNGSFAIYLEPWHADIEVFLQMRKNHGDEELKARDLFYALWIPDLFMERVKADADWTLMCPDECPGLADVCGQDFVHLYTQYEAAGKGRATLKARQLWFQILDAQMETGTPYLCYKDSANAKSNQRNVGVIKSSNLCSEIMQYSDDQETAVCNLASIALPAFVSWKQVREPVYLELERREHNSADCAECRSQGDCGVMYDDFPSIVRQELSFDFETLAKVTKTVVDNLNRVIDCNYYPTPKTQTSNMRHRPVGLGVQGLADVFIQLDMPFASDSARELNRRIFETIYYAALEKSCDLAERDGPYETFAGSPASQGILQFDMWSITPSSGRYDWPALKARIQKVGLRNSLLIAPMPTASTSQILGYNECVEPITSNIYSRRTLAGEFVLANKYLMRELMELGLWNEKIKNNIIANHGSIQHIDVIPATVREKYKTVWEIPMRALIDMAADRGAYVCQSQSLNLWIEDPTYATLTSMHFYAWSKGLKTGIYYLRRRGRHQAQQFTIEPDAAAAAAANYEEEICDMCSA
jgi:ribonucleoside-diphosphate reductase alpha chain